MSVVHTTHEQWLAAERDRAACYPISRWYLRPLAGQLAELLAATPIRPSHLTIAGLMTAACTVALLCLAPSQTPLAAGLVLLTWFCDRADGLLARRQGTASRWGAWLDANLDELVDLGLQVGVAIAAKQLSGSSAPYWLLLAFITGKYLFMYGLHFEQCIADAAEIESPAAPTNSWFRVMYHLPASADVRTHLVVVSLLAGQLTAELAIVAVYYNLRWIARYGLVARRLWEANPS